MAEFRYLVLPLKGKGEEAINADLAELAGHRHTLLPAPPVEGCECGNSSGVRRCPPAALRRTLSGMDELDIAVQPTCPECGVVMRTEPHAFVCPHCGHLQLLDEVEMPPEFDGPEFGRR